jgi:hypothetical protein
MKKINVCVVLPEGYIPAFAMVELGELVFYSIRELGYSLKLQPNIIDPDAQNIILGCHMLSKDLIPEIPTDTIIINTEQVYAEATDWNQNTFEWVNKFQVWDYSEKNISNLNTLGITQVKHLKIGYQKELNRIKKINSRDIDVLFYGSVNDRRAKILNALRESGLNIQNVFGIYGAEKDALIQRSKVVLNLHYYDSQIFEIIRVFYLLTNSIAVVGEVNPTTSIDGMYLNGIYPSQYDSLVESCHELIKDSNRRALIEQRALETIEQYPQTAFIEPLLSSNY